MIQDTLRLIEQCADVVIISATRRLSRRLLFEYHRQQQKKGLKVWPTPEILPWSTWLQKQWKLFAVRTQDRHILLSRQQSLLLWQSIIESDTNGLINIQATARHAQAARQQLIDYRLDLDDEQALQWFVYDHDASRWLEWHRRYIRRLKENDWLDEPALAVAMIDAAWNGEYDISVPLCLVGFDALTPLQGQLRKWLAERSLWIELPAPTENRTRPLQQACLDTSHEMRQAAYWARQQLEKPWNAGDDPIGIVVPGLERQRDRIERVFRDVFYPEDRYSITAVDRFRSQGIRDNAVFNISLGYPLSREPVIAAALDILALCRHQFEFEIFSRVLRSDYVAGATEYASERSLLDMRLRRYVSAEISLKDILAGLPETCRADFSVKLQQLYKQLGKWRGRASTSAWVERFQQCLDIFGWPGKGTHNDGLYQAQKGLDDVWFEFARTDLVHGPVPLEWALSSFNSQVTGRIFQAGVSELPIQILGSMEATGMSFSSLWVTGMSESNWPPSAQPNPFIPLRLQRDKGMPHCSPQRQYEYAELQMRRLLQAAPSVIFSYSLSEGEEECAPSPLIADFPKADVPVVMQQDVPAPVYEYLQDEQGPEADRHHYHAGSGSLRDQAACPFRAFIRHRLKAIVPEDPLPGSDPRSRGRLVHRIMELLWQHWRHSHQLTTMSDEVLSEQVAEAVAQVLGKHRMLNREIEKQRLTRLILEWLEQEKLRQPFEVVALEQEVHTSVNGLNLHLYIDRIDRQPDGSCCIIDYKTGKAKVGNWWGERPDEPQLPLYSIIQQQPVSTVAFASIRAGECRYVGLTRDEESFSMSADSFSNVCQIPVLKGNSSLRAYQDWEAMLSEWRQVIERLAKAHISGDAAINPGQPPLTCRYCDVYPVCRLAEWQQGREVKDNSGEKK